MTVSFFGHKHISEQEKIAADLEIALRNLISEGAVTFLLGGYGDFDLLAALVVLRLKKEFPQIRSTIVLPYLNRSFDTNLYDESIYPPLENVPPRFAILRRNKWMVDHSDVIVSYVRHQMGGADTALRYAERKKKKILYLGRH